ncbi:MAG: pyridoxal phosphate-dependent aminotransferase [Ktedonobacterales bacterium]
MSATKPAFSHASDLTPDTSPLTISDTPDFSAGSPPSLVTSNSHDAAARPDAIHEPSSDNLPSAHALVAAMRDEACERARPLVNAGAAPIRVMASMVAQLEAACRERGIPEQVIASEVVNRTIGDVDLRHISAEDDGPEFVSLADDMGIALPGEIIGGRTSTGARYRSLRKRMMDFERKLLSRRIDLRMYDLAGVGNLLLREMLAEYTRRRWGFTPPPAQIHLSLGALDGLDKFFRGFAMARRNAGDDQIAVVFPAPSFNVPEWQVTSLNMRLHRLTTRPEDHFKVTPEMLRAALDEAPDIRAFYLTVSNNPTAFAYSPGELRALFDVLRGRDVLVVADLAYIGTGDPEMDRQRMQAFDDPETLKHSVLVSSFSKTHTLTGDRCGWVGFGDPALAASVGAGWTNSTAAFPADWQLRYMALIDLFTAHPELERRIRALYKLRRARLIEQLRHIDRERHLFAQVNLDDGGTVYNWSQLRPGEDVFSLFSATGIAGVPGSAFGYSDDFVRLSVGCIPVPQA